MTPPSDPAVVRNRLIRFYLVGAGGLLLQFSVLALLSLGVGWNHLVATAVAVETALLHNFFWHRRWTWPERPESGLASQLISFHFLVGGVSMLGNLVTMGVLVDLAGVPVMPANLLAVAICSAVNYLASDRVIFSIAHTLPRDAINQCCPEQKVNS